MNLTTTLIIILPYIFVVSFPKSWFDWLENYRLGWIILPAYTILFILIIHLSSLHKDTKKR